MRLIDADALIEKYGDWYTEEGTEVGYIGAMKGIINSAPTIEPKQADDLISRADAIEAVERAVTKEVARWSIKELPSAQPDRGYIEQIKWERDLAIQQLADLGYSLGAKMEAERE